MTAEYTHDDRFRGAHIHLCKRAGLEVLIAAGSPLSVLRAIAGVPGLQPNPGGPLPEPES